MSSDALAGSRCSGCANVAFPVATRCLRCGSEAIEQIDLGRTGTVWSYTVQRFAPKSPPYVPPAEGFVPFAVGYVELPVGVRVEAIFDCADFDELAGAQVSLVTASPVPCFATASAVTAEEVR